MKRWGIVALLACLLVCLIATGCTDERDPGPAGEIPAAGGRAAILVRVVDGDTIWVRLDDGTEEKVRYIGLDAPEVAQDGQLGEHLGEEAARQNAALLAEGPLRLTTDVEERDRHGRLLAYVWAGDVLVNERLIRDGYAWARRYPPNLTLQERLQRAERVAREAGVGLWARD